MCASLVWQALVECRARCLLALAKLVLGDATGQSRGLPPPTVVAVALPYLLQALALARAHDLRSIGHTGAVLLSALLLVLGRPLEAVSRLQPAMPDIIENAPVHCRGWASLVLARALLAASRLPGECLFWRLVAVGVPSFHRSHPSHPRCAAQIHRAALSAIDGRKR